MSNPAHQIALLRDQILRRRFDDATLGLLESILISRDVESSTELRSILKDFLRSESLSVINEIAEKPLDQKLLVLEFLIRAFAIVDDVESCLALRYEALAAREFVSSIDQNWQVSPCEWTAFAEDSLSSGFYSIAGKACERALLSHQKDYHKEHDLHKDREAIQKIERLRLLAMSLSSTHSVQLQTSEYLKEKNLRSIIGSSSQRQMCYSASTSFRDGIKKRNLSNLKHLQSIKRTISCIHIGNLTSL